MSFEELKNKVRGFIDTIAPNNQIEDIELENLMNIWIDRYPENSFGSIYYQAIGYLVLHTKEIISEYSNSGQTSKIVTSESEGALSRSYGQIGKTMNDYDKTGWGQSFKQIAKECVGYLTIRTNMML